MKAMCEQLSVLSMQIVFALLLEDIFVDIMTLHVNGLHAGS